jgi:hypothetical protein
MKAGNVEAGVLARAFRGRAHRLKGPRGSALLKGKQREGRCDEGKAGGPGHLRATQILKVRADAAGGESADARRRREKWSKFEF